MHLPDSSFSLPEPPSDLSERARLFKALGDGVRLTILHLSSEHEVCVQDLLQALPMPQATLMHHLAILHQAGMLSLRKRGRWNFYRTTLLARRALTMFA